MHKVVIFGATSAIAQETAKRFAARGDALYLVGRNAEKLETIAGHLRVVSKAAVHTHAVDLNRFDEHDMLVRKAFDTLAGLDVALIAHGVLGDQMAAEKSFADTRFILDTNFISAVSLLTQLANCFERQRNGKIVVISSVAGDRGRQSNYIYGSSKAALSTFTQGLLNRLVRHGVAVITIKPGFVDTPMTANVKKGLLFARPERVAAGILRATDQNRDVVYLPWFWRWIMLIIRLIPESVFKRLKL
jgi:short-subunit dehydrogenase